MFLNNHVKLYRAHVFLSKSLKTDLYPIFIIFEIIFALFICVFIRLGPDPENSIDGLLSLWEITLWDLIPLEKYQFTIARR